MPEPRGACVCGSLHVRVSMCVQTAPLTPLPGPALSPAPSHLPEAVVQLQGLRQPFTHGGDDFLQDLRRGRPAGLCEPLEQRL